MDEAVPSLFLRFSAKSIITAMRDTPVIMLIGPRQCGKTTLLQNLPYNNRDYITLDDDTALAAARSDPSGFIRAFDRITIDEIQRAPELLRAIKKSVDSDRRPGRFILTGSANILTLPQVSESLAGRMEIVRLMPISRAEVLGKRPSFLKLAFAGTVPKQGLPLTGTELVNAILTGGYPEMLKRKDQRRRQSWARDYVNAIVQRDVRDIADIEKLHQLPKLLQIMAHHSGQLTNFLQIGGQIGLDSKTTRKYVEILEQLFLIRQVSPWYRSNLKRLIKTPKLHFVDSGLLASMLALNAEQITKDRTIFGPLLESFIFSEVVKQTGWASENYTLHHYRDKDQYEVDIVIEDDHGAMVAIEVKASATVHAADFKGIRRLSETCGANLKLGVVLYDGDSVVPFGSRMFAVPVSRLWH